MPVDQDGKKNATETGGSRQGKQFLVLLHGGALASSSLHPLVERLPQYHCFTPDLRGHGTKRHVPFTSIEQCADDVAAQIMQMTEGPVHLFGLSLGGYVALNLAARRRAPIQTAIISGVPFGALGGQWMFRPLTALVHPLLGVKRLRALSGRMAGINDTSLMSDPLGKSWAYTSTIRDLAQAALSADPAQWARANPARSLYLAGAREPSAVTKGLMLVPTDRASTKVGTIRDATHGWCLNDPDLAAQIISAWIERHPLPQTVVPLIAEPNHR